MNKEEAKKQVGKNLKRLRQKSGMSQEELALKVGYKGRSAINKIETGTNDMSREMIIKCAQALNVSPVEFFREEPTNPDVAILPAGIFHGGSDMQRPVEPEVLIDFNKLTDKNKEQAMSYIKYLLDSQKGENK